MNREAILAAVEKHRETILAAEAYIFGNPETGYREEKTSRYMEERFRALGYEVTMAEGIPGFYTVVDTGKEGPEVLVLGELDSIICPSHPTADPETGAAHSCGHNAQCAALLGVAAALRDPKVLEGLCGRIRLCAVPAEELLEIEYRTALRDVGKIKYFGGKSEFLRRGYFDGVNLALMVHTSTTSYFSTIAGNIGCIAKKITYKGVSAHAGASPWEGKNALYAATAGINACNALRECFREEDIIRFHPIMTSGGSMVNAIPERAVLESYVRGKTFAAIEAANRRLNGALCGAALSLGVNVEIEDSPGYAPMVNDEKMNALAGKVLKEIYADEEFRASSAYSSGSTDMGDLSCVLPALHAYAPGAEGRSHGNDYRIVDPERACVKSAVWQVGMICALLENGGATALDIMKNHKPLFESFEAFLAYQDSLSSCGDRIVYEGEEARVRL